VSWEPPTWWDADVASDVEDRLRLRVHELARAAGIEAPPVEVVSPEKTLLPAGVRYWPENRLIASSGLARMAPEARDWHLASALGWWASERPRDRRSLLTALRISCAVLLGSVMVGVLMDGMSGWLTAACFLLLSEVGYVVTPWTQRVQQRAMDEAGAEILVSVGVDPASAAREALQGETRPSRWKRLHSTIPAPQDRIAAAERRQGRAAVPLH